MLKAFVCRKTTFSLRPSFCPAVVNQMSSIAVDSCRHVTPRKKSLFRSGDGGERKKHTGSGGRKLPLPSAFNGSSSPNLQNG